MTPPYSDFARYWRLDRSVTFLNHGSFGACPTSVLAAQEGWRRLLEDQPVAFLQRELEGLMDDTRTALGAFVGADPDDIGFVPNATTGVNAVVRSLRFGPDDELLTTDHAYNACKNTLDWVARRDGATVVVAPVPFVGATEDSIFDAVMAKVGDRTRLALLDHVTSPTAVIFPIERLVAALQGRGVDVVVDGAHAPGMLPLDLETLGAAYYAGNCHKWMCAPKGAAFLHVRKDRQDEIVPTTISLGANSTRTDRSRFRLMFDWTGTTDPSPFLAVPEAIRLVRSLVDGGWPEVMERNHRLALQGRDLVANALGIEHPVGDELLGSMAALPIPGDPAPGAERETSDVLCTQLREATGIEIPIVTWPGKPKLAVRLSAHLYNAPEQYELLAGAVPSLRG